MQSVNKKACKALDLDILAETTAGKRALAALTPIPDNFKLFEAETLFDSKGATKIMKLTGGEFRKAKTGKNKDILSILIPGTKKFTYVYME